MTVLTSEKAAIKSVYVDDEHSYSVGVYGTTKIIAFEEYGQMAMVPWIEVQKNGKLHARFEASKALIVYDDESQPIDEIPF